MRGLAEWRRPGADPQAILAAVRWLDDELAPAARQVLGDAAPAFVAGFFRWAYRVNVYYYLMRDEYPPFSLK